MNVNTQGSFSSYAAYSRFFIADDLPDYIDKILYIDCDTCVVSSLEDLFNINIDNYVLAGVLDILPSSHKKHINFTSQDMYYNSGVLLFNCKKWKEEGYTHKIYNHISSIESMYSFHDQDLINIICKNKIFTLPPEYMVFYPEYTWGYEYLNFLNEIDCKYYNDMQLKNAINNPIIIHYVDSIVGRPWYENNINNFASYWLNMLEKCPVIDSFLFIKKSSSFRHKGMRFLYNYFPLKVFLILHKYRRNQLLKNKEDRIKKEKKSNKYE